MTIDNDRKARAAHLNLDAVEDINKIDETLDLEPERSQTWRLGSPEGKKTNIRIMAVDLAKDDPRYHSLEERLRDFIACNMPEEAVQLQFEDDIYVSPNLLKSIWSYGSEETASHDDSHLGTKV